MCVNKVYVRDLFHPRRGNYFSCGRCPACLQARANKRSVRIAHHNPAGFIPYFVTLGYSNKSIPYVRISDLKEFQRLHQQGQLPLDAQLPVYRDTVFCRRGSSKLKKRPDTVVGFVDFTPFSSYYAIDNAGFSGLRTKVGKDKFVYDTDKISIAFASDSQKFVKRLRRTLELAHGSDVPISYYYAPEYGPTTQRYHAHYLIWFPSYITENKVKRFIHKAWPFENPNRTVIEVARNASSYVSAYINCSADVSEYLRNAFPLRPSHSLAFGYEKDLFDLPTVLSSYFRGRNFKFISVGRDANGCLVETPTFYPQYVVSRFFPKFKGFSRLTRSKVVDALANPEKYFTFSKLSPKDYFEIGRQYSIYSYRDRVVTRDGDLDVAKATRLVDVYGVPVFMTDTERLTTIGVINRAYARFAELGYNRLDFANIVYDYYVGRASALYADSQSHFNPIDNVLQFFNLPQVVNGKVNSDTVLRVLSTLPLGFEIGCNSLPDEVQLTKKLIDKFNKYIKIRKINSL